MLGDLENESIFETIDFKSVQNGRNVTFELDIDDGTDNLGYLYSLT